MKKITILIILFHLVITIPTIAQGNLGIGTLNPHPSALLELSSTDKGLLIPRMTQSQRDSIVSPEFSLMIYNLTSNCIELWLNEWQKVWCSCPCCYTFPSPVPTVTNPVTGRIWMDRNLGASQVATSSTDTAAYGDLYQWGRGTDCHEKRNSATTSILSSTDNPGHGLFITIFEVFPFDWRSPQNNNLWQGVNGINNPCPPGFRLPTDAEWDAERLSWSTDNASGAFNSPLKLPVAGLRGREDILEHVGLYGRYLSSTAHFGYHRDVYFGSINAGVNMDGTRAGAGSVRCIKDVALPAQPLPINGQTNPCENEPGLLYNVTNVSGVTYTWTVPL